MGKCGNMKMWVMMWSAPGVRKVRPPQDRMLRCENMKIGKASGERTGI
jgi:hypothetical protein